MHPSVTRTVCPSGDPSGFSAHVVSRLGLGHATNDGDMRLPARAKSIDGDSSFASGMVRGGFVNDLSSFYWLRTICAIFATGIVVGCSLVLAQADGLPQSPPQNSAPVVMADRIQQFAADRDSLDKKYEYQLDPNYSVRMLQFYRLWEQDLERIPFDTLGQDDRIDYLLLRNRIQYLRRKLEIETQQDQAIWPLIPGGETVVTLWTQRLQGARPHGRQVAEQYETIRQSVQDLAAKLRQPDVAVKTVLGNPTLALWVNDRLQHTIQTMDQVHRYYDGYDPEYSWWARTPWENLRAELQSYAGSLRQASLGRQATDPDAIVGQPIGAEALEAELRNAMIAYSPAELVRIGELEMAWCDQEMDKVAAEMGFDDWREAQEAVKERFVPPGEQVQLIIGMANEAIDYITERDLVTVPELSREVWRTQMMSPQRQRLSPFFLGGDTIIISYPTDEMTHEEKLMSLRGNNPHFSRAVVHHELIPGHHLQQFMLKRHKTYRREFATPFWMEGWALYWEMLLWDLGFAQTPEDRLGMLFWRKHRCARIIFSLNYHLNRMTPEECVDYLVDRVGHERNNATAEVRRSFTGGYGPLYQAAYMLGGLQIRELHDTLVKSGKMNAREFHDTILQQHSMPIEMLRAKLLNLELTQDWQPGWRFYPAIEGQ